MGVTDKIFIMIGILACYFGIAWILVGTWEKIRNSLKTCWQMRKEIFLPPSENKIERW